jgi:hypothetical protein
LRPGWTAAAALADDADHCVAVADVIVEPAKQRVAVAAQDKVALHTHEEAARPQIGGEPIARFAKFV